MGQQIRHSICDLCTKAARKRCQAGMTRKCDRLLGTFEKADIIGAKYHLFASGKCIFA
ncbi:MAG: hypothetical protein V3V63_03280 [Candidatus Hydrothermarchaeaceae archaeon]|jgi:hypothetical protein